MSEKKLTPLQRLFRLLSTEKKLVGNIYVFALFNGLLNLSIPLGIQAIINLIQSGTSSTSWVVLVILVLVGLSLAGIFQIYQLSAAETIQQKIFANASMEFAYRIPRLRLSALKASYPPELVNRFFDIMTVQKGLSKILFDFSLAALQIFFGLLLLALYHPFFIAFGILLLIILVGFFFLTGKGGLRTSLEESNHKYKLVGWLEEIGRNLSTFKMAGNTQLPLEQTDRLSSKYLKARKEHFGWLVRQYGILIGFKVLISGALLVLGGILVFRQEMNIGQFVAAEIIILLVINSVDKLILSMETIYDVLTGLEKVGGITDLGLEQTEGTEKIARDVSGLFIKAQNITLPSPQRPEKVVLEDVSFEINSGEKIGIAGKMGAGKSALLHLLAGLFDRFEGTLLFNNIPFQHLDLESLRSAIGDNLGTQEIFEATLMENITVGQTDVSQEEVRRIVRLSGLEKFMEQLPMGLHTKLATSGLGLSESLRSRILMARSLAGNHQLLLIEDNWRGVNEEIVMNWFETLCDSSNRTVVTATNNRDLLQKMDRVFLFEEGKLKMDGHYKTVEYLL